MLWFIVLSDFTVSPVQRVFIDIARERKREQELSKTICVLGIYFLSPHSFYSCILFLASNQCSCYAIAHRHTHKKTHTHTSNATQTFWLSGSNTHTNTHFNVRACKTCVLGASENWANGTNNSSRSVIFIIAKQTKATTAVTATFNQIELKVYFFSTNRHSKRKEKEKGIKLKECKCININWKIE